MPKGLHKSKRLFNDVRARARAGTRANNRLGELVAAEGLELAVVGLEDRVDLWRALSV